LLAAAWTDTPGLDLVVVDYDVQDEPAPDRALMTPRLDPLQVDQAFAAEEQQRASPTNS
jgi:hypothetical protein